MNALARAPVAAVLTALIAVTILLAAETVGSPIAPSEVSFTLERPDTAGLVFIGAGALEVDSSERPHVVYWASAHAPAFLHAWRGASGWATEPVVSDVPVALALDANDEPWILCRTDANAGMCPECEPTANLWLVHRSGESWIREALGQTLYTTGSAAGFDPSGVFHAVYLRYKDPSGPTGLVYATLEDGTWTVEPIAATAAPDPLSLAFDSHGTPHLAWTNHYGPYGTFYAARTLNGWAIEEIPGFHSPSLAIDRDDRPVIVLSEPLPGSMRYLVRKDGGWIDEDVGVAAMEAALQVDRYGRPLIAYTAQGRRISFAWKERGVWHTQLLDDETVAFSVSLALANGSDPQISYEDFERYDFCFASASMPAPPPLEARAVVEGASRAIPVGAGSPDLCVLLDATNPEEPNDEIVTSSVVMRSEGTGSVSEIPGVFFKTTPIQDGDRNGIDETRLCFEGEDLAPLFSALSGRSQVDVAIEGTMTSGERFRASLVLDVLPVGPHRIASVYPNPLNPTGRFGLLVSRPGRVRVRLFHATGSLARTLFDGWAERGYLEIPLSASDGAARLASGIYFYEGEASGERFAGRFAVMK